MSIKIIKKNVKKMKLSVVSRDDIIVVLPKELDESAAYDFITKHKNWIEKTRKKFKKNNEIFYLGNKFFLKIVKSNHNFIEIKDKNFIVYSEILQKNYIDNIINNFYMGKAKKILPQILEKYLCITNKNINKCSIKILRSQWGSCNYVKKNIYLNARMVQYDIKFCEYVILHEIAHLTHPNHSKDFYNYISKYMPDWREYKISGGVI